MHFEEQIYQKSSGCNVMWFFAPKFGFIHTSTIPKWQSDRSVLANKTPDTWGKDISVTHMLTWRPSLSQSGPFKNKYSNFLYIARPVPTLQISRWTSKKRFDLLESRFVKLQGLRKNPKDFFFKSPFFPIHICLLQKIILYTFLTFPVQLPWNTHPNHWFLGALGATCQRFSAGLQPPPPPRFAWKRRFMDLWQNRMSETSTTRSCPTELGKSQRGPP